MDRDFLEGKIPDDDIRKLEEGAKKAALDEANAGDCLPPHPNPLPQGEREQKRDYTRQVYQNLMAVVELLERKAPLPMSQKQIAEATGRSKATVFDICWNLTKRGWAEDAGDGSIRLKKASSEKDAFMGRMVIRLVRDTFGVDLNEVKKG